MKNQIRYAAGITTLIRDLGWFPAINHLSFEEAKKKAYPILFCQSILTDH